MTRLRKSKGDKGRTLHFRPYKPWSPLIPFDVPVEAKSSNVVASFQNHLITVFVKQAQSPLPGPNGGPSKVCHLMMVWTDPRRKEEIPYRFKQQAKRELCSEMAEAVELFPADWREQDMVQTHLWVLEPGATFPFGLIPNDPEEAIAKTLGGRENLVTKEELEVFVVRHPDGDDEIIEVFESEEECLALYEKNGSSIPETSTSKVEMIGDVPAEDSGIAWSDRAKVKVANVLAKSRAMEAAPHQEAPQLFYDHYTVEDDIEEEFDMEDAAGPGDEEHVAIAMAMEEALKNKADDRAAKVRAVTEEVIGRAGENIIAARKSSMKPKIVVPR